MSTDTTVDEKRAELVAIRTAAWEKVTGPRIDRTSTAFHEWETAAHAVIDHDETMRAQGKEKRDG